MNIRIKVLAFLALLFLLFGAVQILIQQRVLMPSFASLEREDARTSIQRIGNALQLAQERLEINATDWANWADTYRFMRSHDPAYAAQNLTAVALRQLNLNVMMVVDEAGRIVLQSARDLRTGQALDLDLTRATALPADFPWRRRLVEARPAHGFLSTNLGVLMMAKSPVLDGMGGGPARGAVIVGRLLSDAEIESLGVQAQVAVRRSDLPPGVQVASREELVETAEQTQVYRTFTDIYGRPLLTLRVDIPRRVTETGRGAVTYASIYLAVAAVGVLLMLALLLDRLVFAPLGRVTRHAVAIGENTETPPLETTGDDEIAVLARELDRMVGRLATARRELVDRSFQAGFAELARGVLHNLGNAMTPLGVRLAALQERLQRVPAADLERAAAELADPAADPARRADLVQFLRLGARELNNGLQQSQQDVAVMQRQANIVQGALSEQMKSSRGDQVIEAVKLPDLVSQSLDIVPDACRQRLNVEADESLLHVGVVRVARTVLRLILQNFIINAADAVREAGRDRGRLRVAAEILNGSGGEQLHLYCEDNGAGIAPDNLERVFEQGFSTKSRETNHGIGLHWCANAVAALGGRIWASSEGPGRGASLHVLVPLKPAAAV